MDIQVLRNLTTGKLHTKMEDIYTTVEYLTTKKGVMTHQLGSAAVALQPYLVKKLEGKPRFFDGKYDTTHTGEVDIPPMDPEEHKRFQEIFTREQKSFWENFR